MLREHFPATTFSGVYLTAARDEEDQDDFLNAVAKIETEMGPEDVHSILQSIEITLQKDPPYPKGPRTIDLDILLYGDEEIHTKTLDVPHPRMWQRRFVLQPLYELEHNDEWHKLLNETEDQSCKKTEISL